MLAKICKKYKLLGQILKELINRQKMEDQILEMIQAMSKRNQIKIVTEIKLNKFKYLIPDIK